MVLSDYCPCSHIYNLRHIATYRFALLHSSHNRTDSRRPCNICLYTPHIHIYNLLDKMSAFLYSHNNFYSLNKSSRHSPCKMLPQQRRRIRRICTNPDIGRKHISRRRPRPRRSADRYRSQGHCGKRICHNSRCCKNIFCWASVPKNIAPFARNLLPCRLYHRRACMKHICRHKTVRRRNKVWYRFPSCWRHKHISDNKNCQRDRDYRHVTRPDRTSRHIQPPDIVPAACHNPGYRRDCHCHFPAFRHY